MAAVSRFVEFSATEETFVTGTSADASESATQGSRGFAKGTGLSSGEDSFTITLNSNDQLSVNINSEGARLITLSSGTDLDPRFVARDISYKLHSLSSPTASYKFAQCEFRNGYGPISNAGDNSFNEFIIWTGMLGDGTGAANDVVLDDANARVIACRTTLGFDTGPETAGIDWNVDFSGSSYVGTPTPSGVYTGQFYGVGYRWLRALGYARQTA